MVEAPGPKLIVLEELEVGGGLVLQPGDVAPLRFRSVRLAALAHPERFQIQRAPEPVDVDSLREIHQAFEQEYQQAREAADRRRREVVKTELATTEDQRRSSKALEARYARQEAEKIERERERKAERERQAVEANVRALEPGYHFER